MKTIGNVLWFIFTGLWAGLAFFASGIALCITIIGIPFGLQCFKLGKLMFWPFGKNITTNFEKHPIMNIIWIVLFGWEMTIGYLTMGIVYCITIIGIPFGLQCFKLMKLAFFPIGADMN